MGACQTSNNHKQTTTGASSGFTGLKNDETSNAEPMQLIPEEETLHSLKKTFEDLVPDTSDNKPLQFELHLNNFIIKGLQGGYYYFAELLIPQADQKTIKERITPIKGPNPKFNFDKKFLLEIEFEKLKCNYLKIFIFKIPETEYIRISNFETYRKNLVYISSLMIDMMTIALGPEHHDIKLIDSCSRAQIGRIKFNICCNHIAQISVSIESISCRLMEKTNNMISFKLSYKDIEHLVESDYSLVNKGEILKNDDSTLYKWFKANTNEKIDLLEIKDNLLMSIMEFRSSLLVLNVYDTIFEMLENLNNETKNPLMPPIKRRITNIQRHFSICKEANAQFQEFQKHLQPRYTNLGSASLNLFQLLKHNENLMEKQRSQIFINSASLYAKNNSKFKNNNSNDDIRKEEYIKLKVFDDVNQNFKEEIYLTGAKIGIIEGNICIQNIPLLRQIMCGVHTEKGLDLSSAYLGLIDVAIVNKDQDNTLPESLTQLIKNSIKLFQKISGNSISLTKLSSEYKDNNDEINSILDNIITNLSYSDKESVLYYNYFTPIDIMKGQQALIDLGVKILSVVDNLNIDHRLKALNILTLIMERGEIDLASMSGMLDQNIEKYNEICENLMFYHNRLLDYALTKLGRKSTDENTKKFLEVCVAYCYFRIPNFQKTFLEIISNDLKPNEKDNSKDYLNEKEYVENELIEKSQTTNENEEKLIDDIKNPIVSLIDWSNLFYGKLKNKGFEKEVLEKEEEMEVRLKKPDWRKRIEKKGLAFFSIIKKLEEYFVKKMIVKRDINWFFIPGFKIIISAVIHQLKNFPTTSYTQPMIDIMKIFINKPYIMNTFFSIIVEKTNSYDTNAVFMLFRILDSFFTEYENTKSFLSTSTFSNKFDYNKLKTAMLIIIEKDHSLCLSKVIWFYYKNSSIMPIDHVHIVVTRLFFDKIFFHLFFHWSWQVRNMLYYFLLFTMGHQIKNRTFQGDRVSVANGRMELLKNKDSSLLKILGTTNYPEKLKSEILSSYYDKARIIQKIKRATIDKNCDPTYRIEFETDIPEIKEILTTQEIRSNIVIGIHHFSKVEEEFNLWVKGIKGKKDFQYPDIDLQPPKDDIVEYNSSEITIW